MGGKVSALVEVASHTDRDIVPVDSDQVVWNQHSHCPGKDAVADFSLLMRKRGVPDDPRDVFFFPQDTVQPAFSL